MPSNGETLGKKTGKQALASGRGQGRNIDLVQIQDYPVSRLPDLKAQETAIRDLYQRIEEVETTAKLDIYKRLALIYEHRDSLLDEYHAKHFPKYIESLGVSRSTSYKDAKVVEFLVEYDIVHLLNQKTVKNLVRKLKEAAYKSHEDKEELLPKLGKISLEDIRLTGRKETSGHWVKSAKIPSMRHKINKNKITLDIESSSVRSALHNILIRLDRKTIFKLEKELKSKDSD